MQRARSKKAKDARRQILLKAALDEFYEQGFSASRMDDIAARAGLSKGTLYLYFKNKDAVFEELITNLTSANLAQMESTAEASPSLEFALSWFADFAPMVVRSSELPKLMKVLIGDSHIFPETIGAYRKNVLDRILGALALVLEKANERGEINVVDPALTARLVIAPVVLSGIWEAVFARDDKNPVDLQSLFRAHAEIFMNGARPKKDSV